MTTKRPAIWLLVFCNKRDTGLPQERMALKHSSEFLLSKTPLAKLIWYSRTLDKEQRDYAWVIRLYCLLHAAPQVFHKEVHRCPFGHTSPHWVRFQCARVFSGVTDTSEHKKLRSLFGKTLEEPSNESQKHDLEKALQFLNAKPLARGAKCALI